MATTTKPIKDERYVFEVEWYDPQADIVRHYRLFYFPVEGAIEMYDKKMERPFLKKVEVPGLSLKDFFIGARVTIFSRVVTVVAFGDIATQVKQSVERESTFAMIKPDSYNNFGKIVDAIQQEGFLINRFKMSRFTKESTEGFYAEHVGKAFFPNLQESICSDVVIGMELIADNAIKKWRQFIGPTNSEKARAEAPKSLRAIFGTDGTRNAVHGSDSTASARREIEFWFGGDANTRAMKTTAVMNNCTLCIIKPHIIKNNQAGQVIDMILQAGFEISAAEMFNLSRPMIEEFYSVY